MIKTKRLLLVPLSKENSKDFIKLLGDYDVIKYTYSTLSKTQDECSEKLINWLPKVKEHWGKGYAFEAADALLNYILEKHPNGTIVADAVVDNPASVKILTKLGFSKTRVEEKGFKNNGMELDIIHFNYNKQEDEK